MKGKKKDLEIRFYENLVKENPDFIQALSCLGDAYTNKGFYEEGLKVDRRLVKLRPDDSAVHYNLACSLSLLGREEEALPALKRAVLLGYDDFAYLLNDADLENVRRHPHFASFLAKMKKNFFPRIKEDKKIL